MLHGEPGLEWYQRLFAGTGLAGGLIMLLGAALAHDAATVPLLAIGACWAGTGAGAGWRGRHVACQLRLEGDTVIFAFPAHEIRVPAQQVRDLQRSRLDPSRMRPLRVSTESQGLIRVSPRLTGLFDFLHALRLINPGVHIHDL